MSCGNTSFTAEGTEGRRGTALKAKLVHELCLMCFCPLRTSATPAVISFMKAPDGAAIPTKANADRIARPVSRYSTPTNAVARLAWDTPRWGWG